MEVDETTLATDHTQNFSTAFNINYGADGAGTTVYSLGISGAGVPSGVVDVATGQGVYLFLESGSVVGRVGSGGVADAGGAEAFRISVNAGTGEVTLDQVLALTHPTGGTGSPNELINLTTNAVTLTATVTDRDGDTASASISLGDKVGFRDDAPTIVTTGAVINVEVDETTLATDHTQNFSTAFNINYGADGAGTTVYSLGISGAGVPSGVVDVATGQGVYLFLESGSVVGRVGSGGVADAGGAEAFRISVNAGTGEVTLDQVLALTHPTGGTTNGVVTVAADGTITFTPNTGFVGQVSFPYTISDEHGGSSTATETITITNTAPAAVNDNYTTPHNTPVVLNPLQGDTDPENDALSITSINGVTLTPGTAQSIPVTNGVVTVAADGTITFTPNTGFVGQVSFPYTISDGHGGTSQAIETITITNTAPELTSGSARVSEEGLVGGLADSNGNDLTNSRTFNGSLVGADVDSDAVLTYAFTGVPSEALTSNGVAVVWTLVSATEVVGTANGIPVVSVILDSATGDYTVTLDKAVDHADMTQEDILDFTIPTSVTDNHGATAASTLNVIVEDDGPSVTTNAVLTVLEVDETVLTTNDSENFASAFTVNTYGADGQALSNALVYSLGISSVGAVSGVIDVATGQAVYLYALVTGEVVGLVGAGGFADPLGAEAFRISVNAATGQVDLDQVRALQHPNPAQPNELINLTTNAVTLIATATDKDGDSAFASISLGDKVGFRDDAPTIVTTGAVINVEVDETT
ncbi:hypothetical protein F989_00049, partial [Acinetobacter parvus NIPH 1103]